MVVDVAELEATAELAAAHGLTEQGGWVNYSRTEVLWVMGDWDDALEVGQEVIELGERYAYQRLAYRTWVIVLPIAAARGDGALADIGNDGGRRLRPLPGHAVAIRACDARGDRHLGGPGNRPAGGAAGRPPHGCLHRDEQPALPRCRRDARPRLARCRPHTPRHDRREALGRVRRRVGRHTARASAALIDAWTTGSAESARTAATLAGDFGAPWWELRALRVLDDPRAAELERALGIG